LERKLYENTQESRKPLCKDCGSFLKQTLKTHKVNMVDATYQ